MSTEVTAKVSSPDLKRACESQKQDGPQAFSLVHYTVDENVKEETVASRADFMYRQSQVFVKQTPEVPTDQHRKILSPFSGIKMIRPAPVLSCSEIIDESTQKQFASNRKNVRAVLQEKFQTVYQSCSPQLHHKRGNEFEAAGDPSHMHSSIAHLSPETSHRAATHGNASNDPCTIVILKDEKQPATCNLPSSQDFHRAPCERSLPAPSDPTSSISTPRGGSRPCLSDQSKVLANFSQPVSPLSRTDRKYQGQKVKKLERVQTTIKRFKENVNAEIQWKHERQKKELELIRRALQLEQTHVLKQRGTEQETSNKVQSALGLSEASITDSYILNVTL